MTSDLFGIALENAWEEGFAALKTFKAREGHCHVPKRHIEGTFRLGQWVGVQRTNKDTMPAERKQRLDAIGFVWDPLESSMGRRLCGAKEVSKRAKVTVACPQLHIEGTFKLGRWVSEQRTNQRHDVH